MMEKLKDILNKDLSLIHSDETTRRNTISYAVDGLKKKKKKSSKQTLT